MISIIIPVYNASKYISKCLESVICQTYNNFEVVIVNDGSTDNSLEICNKYSLQDYRIKIVNKENGGVSSSRNIGIEKSSGDWITFLDADDWFEPDCLSFCVQKLNSMKIELLCFNHYINTETNQWKMNSLTNCLLTRERDELKSLTLDMMFPNYDFVKNNVQVGSIRAVWGKFFRLDIIKQHRILFDVKIKIAEDAIFCLEYISHINIVALYNNYLLHYRVHNSSVMNRYQPDINSVNEKILKTFYTQFQQQLLTDKDYLICYTGNAIECLFRALKLNILHKENKTSFKTKLNEISQLIRNEYLKIAYSCDANEYFPLGKKELLFFAKKNNPLGIYVVGRLSLFALYIQSVKMKIKHIEKYNFGASVKKTKL
jgi:glycosyltransferase involved in cell wall biosynthesis